MISAAINGFGRIGRLTVRVWLDRDDLFQQISITAINTSGSMPIGDWAHLLKYDTAYGPLREKIGVEEVRKPDAVSDKEPLIGFFTIRGKKIPVLAQREPEKLPWKEYKIDLVIESTGKFRNKKEAENHLNAGAQKVLLSAPGKGGDIYTHVLGVNKYSGKGKVIDNASCTTNCVAPVAAILHSEFGIEKATLTTIHAYTDGQRLQDNSHNDLRRARAAALNIVPTTTGAAKTTTKIIPELQGLFDGIAIRVPVITGSISDLVFVLNKQVTVEEINEALKKASKSPRWKGIVAVTHEPLVSSDIIGRRESTIVDLSFTQVIGGDLVKILAWYDNEWGYTNRLLEQATQIG